MARRIFLMAMVMAIGTLWFFGQNLDNNGLVKALTLSLTTMAVFQWFNAWNCRSEDKSIFQMNPLANKFLLGATVLVIGLQLLALHNPLMQQILHTEPLNRQEWLWIVLIGSSILWVEEIRKLFHRFFKPVVV
jgi:Ca2+-transporting ATPase